MESCKESTVSLLLIIVIGCSSQVTFGRPLFCTRKEEGQAKLTMKMPNKSLIIVNEITQFINSGKLR